MVSAFNLRSCLVYSATLFFIAAAVSFSLLRTALPHAHGYVAELESTLTEQLGLRVDIGALDAEMSWFTPRLILLAPRVRDKDDAADLLSFERIELSLSYLDSLRFMSLRVAEINVVVTELLIERLSDQAWRVQGLELAGGDDGLPDDLRSVLENTGFLISARQVSLVDKTGEYNDAVLKDVDISVSHFLGKHTVTAGLSLPQEYGDSLTLSSSYSGPIEAVFTQNSEIYLAVQNANAQTWMQRLKLDTDFQLSGRHDLEIWLSLSAQEFVEAVVDVDGRDVSVSRGSSRAWQAERVSGLFRWKRTPKGWLFDVRDLEYSRDDFQWSRPADIRLRYTEDRIRVAASYFNFRDVAVLADLLRMGADDKAARLLLAIDDTSELYGLDVDIRNQDISSSSVHFAASDFGIDYEGVSVAGMDFVLDFHEGTGELSLATTSGALEDPSMFRKEISLERLNGVIAVAYENEQWNFTSELVELDNPDISTRNRLHASWQESSGLFLDMQTMYSGARGSVASAYYPLSQLDPELVNWLDTAITDGRVEQGYFMFYGNGADFPFNRNGMMLAGFDVNDMNLVFDKDWPPLGKLKANVLFDNKSMVITGHSAQQYGARLKKLTARIDDLYESVLTIEGAVDTPVTDIQKYILNSPLDKTLGGAMTQLESAGMSELGLRMRIPLDDVDKMDLQGTLDFKNSELEYPGLQYRLASIQGQLGFDDESMWSNKLTATLGGRALAIDIESDNDDQGRYTNIHFRGDLLADDLLTRFDWVPTHWLSGSSPWDIRLTIPHYQSRYDVLVDATSTLEGVEVSVSDAISKQGDVSYPLNLSARIQRDSVSLEADMPADNMFTAMRDVEGMWKADLKLAHIKGKLEFDETLNVESTISLDLEQLDLTALTERQADSSEAFSISPASIPSIRMQSKSVSWRRWQFDQLQLNTDRHAHGMLMSKIDARARDLAITGQGTWLTSWRRPHETSMTLHVTSTNCGNALEGQGFDRVLDRCTQGTNLVLQWPAEPYRFNWMSLKGTADIEMKQGVVRDVDAGTGGRVVGLLNVFHLPRRLLLDFSDLNEDGFVFDSITSKLEFADGFATTTDTDILASIADMRVTGKIDMHNEVYDLVVRVKPNQTAATFTGGAIAGGAAVGAGLVLLQKLLNLDKASQDRYAITGNWDAPKVTQIEKAEPVTAAVEDDEDVDSEQ